jgi:hypothetical protein
MIRSARFVFRFHIKLTTFSKNYPSEEQAEEAGVSFAKQMD